MSIIPQMIISQVDECWFAYTGNRRLWVFRELEKDGSLGEIDVKTTNQKIGKKRFTTNNNGATARVRWQGDTEPETVQTFEYGFFADADVQDAYMNSTGCSQCVALNHDQSGWASLFSCEGKFSVEKRSIPQGLWDSILLEIKAGNNPTLFACGSNERYFVQFQQRNSWFAVSGNSFRNAIHEGEPLEAICFAPENGYWLRRVDGSTLWQRLPRSLDNLLEESQREVEYVSISPSGGAWFVRFLDNTVLYRGISKKCTEEVKHQQAQGRVLFQLNFGANDDFVMIARGP